MPKRPSAKNLKECALNSVAQNIEEICYGYSRGSKELAKFYHEEQYLEVEGPFVVRFSDSIIAIMVGINLFSLQIAIHNELKHGKSPFWQENALFVSKAKINVF